MLFTNFFPFLAAHLMMVRGGYKGTSTHHTPQTTCRWELPDGTHTVKVLYNREEIEIPHCNCPEGATLESFASEVLGPFLLSQAEATEACRVTVQHEGAMPQPSKLHIGMGGSDDKGE
jgi:hypothetical protein